MERVLALVNTSAGSTHEEAVAEALGALREEADVEVGDLASPEDLHRALASAAGRRLVVLGGDGTLHAVVQALWDAGRLAEAGPVGIVPLGTGNDLARSLGLPVDDPAAAARLALHGAGRSLEMLTDDDGGVVVNAVHVGVGAEAAERAAAAKHGLGRAAYPLGAVAAGISDTGHRIRVVVDGEVLHDGDEPVLMVALGLGTSIGGGARVAPDATPFDGRVTVVVSTSTGPLARLGYALTMRDGEHVGRHDVRTTHGCEVALEALDAHAEFRTVADGELAGPFSRRTFTVHPDAWQVVLPT